MATSRTTTPTAAKKAVTKKTAVKKTAKKAATMSAKKSAAKKPVAKQAAKAPAMPKPAAATPVASRVAMTGAALVAKLDTAGEFAADVVEATNERLGSAADWTRNAAVISVGLPFAVQARIADNVAVELPVRNLDLATLKKYVANVGAPRFDLTGLDLRVLDIDVVKELLADAKTQGTARVTELQRFTETFTAPIAKRVDDTMAAAASLADKAEHLVNKAESQLPTQLRSAVVEGRKRVRRLIAA